jgi:deoxyribose-phosphate aldolase
MDISKVMSHVDHTLLKTTAVWDDIRTILDDAINFKCASACIPPSFVTKAAAYVADRLPICTVIGFPNGYNTTAVKVFETKNAVENGAAEVDLVINVGWAKAGMWRELENEIREVRAAAKDIILKVIIETCDLSEAEKIELCQIVTNAGADFIKTSTGFSKGGATKEDVALLRKHVGPDVGVKASGGISSFADAVQFIELGATRLGTSRLVALAKNG